MVAVRGVVLGESDRHLRGRVGIGANPLLDVGDHSHLVRLIRDARRDLGAGDAIGQRALRGRAGGQAFAQLFGHVVALHFGGRRAVLGARRRTGEKQKGEPDRGHGFFTGSGAAARSNASFLPDHTLPSSSSRALPNMKVSEATSLRVFFVKSRKV